MKHVVSRAWLSQEIRAWAQKKFKAKPNEQRIQDIINDEYNYK